MASIVQGLLGGSAPPSVRKPEFEIDFGESAALVSVSVECGLSPFVDVATLWFSAGSASPAPGDAGSISLGYEDAPSEAVFKGKVSSVKRSIDGTIRVTAVNQSSVLAGLRLNQSYEKQKAGDIVKDLAGRAGVATETVDDGIEFPFYVVDDGQSAWQHVAELARKSGYLAWVTGEDKLHFAAFSPGDPAQVLTYGTDLLALELADDGAPEGKFKTVGEGAAGSDGSDAWNWIVKDASPVEGEAGDGDNERLVSDPSLRSANAAGQAAEGHANAAALARSMGRLVVPGAPAVTAGSVIEIAGTPGGGFDGKYLARWVRHVYSKEKGFTSRILVSKTGGAGGLLGGLL